MIEYANIPKIRVSFYLVDIEVLFSKNPFMVSGSVSQLDLSGIGHGILQLCAAFPDG